MSKNEFTLFISGTEPMEYFSIVAKETPNMLLSYWHIYRKKSRNLKERYDKRPDLRLIVDSGAHTFNTTPEFEEKDLDFWEKYIQGYIKWAKENKEHIAAIFELDIDKLVGPAKVEEWRQKYFEPLEKEGIEVIYVWHGFRGIKEWERLCSKYPYVALTFIGDKEILDHAMLSKLFMTARKYKTRIHGLACTALAIMERYPWYSVDSSTWLVGTQFGEVNYFDGRKSHRLKKAMWKKQYKTKLIKLGANWAAMEREDPYELQRVNILTLMEVEKYVKRRLKGKYYWGDVMRRKVKLVGKRKTIAPGTVPSLEWFDGDMDDWEQYAMALNIDTNKDKEYVCNAMRNFYVFCTQDKELIGEYTDVELYALCDAFKMDKIAVNTRAKALVALEAAFKDHAAGKRKDFIDLSDIDDEDAPPPEPKERDNYVEENQYEVVERTEQECNSILSRFLPEGKGMPEIEAYDEELKKMDIIPVRDSQGRFVKGQQLIRKNKKIYSQVFPKLSCDTCIGAQNCPKRMPGHVCAFNKAFAQFDTRNRGDVLDIMHSIVGENLKRLQRAMVFETMDGGMTDAAVTSLIDQNMKYLQMITQLETMGKKIVAQQRVINEDGKVETVTTVTGNPEQGGILSQFFNNIGKGKLKEEEELITVNAEVICSNEEVLDTETA